MMHENNDPAVVIGIDTHADTHHLAVVTAYGRPLEDFTLPATSDGYRQALDTVVKYPIVDKIGIECTGCYGAGITRDFTAAGYSVVEVNPRLRPI